VNDDLDRWVNLEGPPPEGVRELLDAACDVPGMTPEQEARLDLRLFAALAEDRRRRARRRALKRILGGGLAAACLGGAMVVAFRWDSPPELDTAQRVQPNVTLPSTEQRGGTESPAQPAAPAVLATSESQGTMGETPKPPARPDALRAPGVHSEPPPPAPRLRKVAPPRRGPGSSGDR
jgi:hypothetical protein